MKNLKRIVYLALFTNVILCINLAVFAQKVHKWCGTEVVPELYQKEVELIKSPNNPYKNLRSSAILPVPTLHIPVSIFFVGKSDTTGHKDIEQYLSVMCKTNEEYNKIGINYYLYKNKTSKKLGIDYTLNNDTLYNGFAGSTKYQRITSYAFFNNKRFNQNSVNLYRTNVIDASVSGNTILGRSTFPGQSFFVPDIGEFQGGIELADDDYTTWIHELGHFFNLYHPFQSSKPTPDELVFRCKKVMSMEKVVIKSAGGPVISLVSNDAQCTNQKGSITATVTGGSGSYTYSWGNGETTPAITNLNGGTYYLTVTDASGCVATAAATINNITGPTVSISTTGTTCNLVNGKAVSVVSGGKAPYYYSWSNGKTSSQITTLSAGIYNLTVTDTLGCKAMGMANIGSNINTPVISITSTDATCNNNNGQATALVSGGQTPYQFNWNNGSATAVNSNIGKGTFYLTVTDNRNCIAYDSVLIDNISGPSALIISMKEESCGNNNGSLSATFSGGTSPFSFKWSNNKTTALISNLSTGLYKLTVTDANGCTLIGSSVVDSILHPAASLSSTATACGKSIGTSNVTVVNGTQPYSYLWSNGDTASFATNLSEGIYYLTVTDSDGCTVSDSTIISNLDGPSVTLSNTLATCDSSDGTATANITGGVSPYSYAWGHGDSTSTVAGLSLGNYQVTITDKNGCSASGIITIENAGGPQIVVTSSLENCGKNDGTVNVFVSGGLPPYKYLWSTNDSTALVSNLSAGNYFITVSDSANCIKYGMATVSSFGNPKLTLSAIHESCSKGNGQVSSVASEGTLPYVYLWSNGDDSSVVINLNSGVYKLSVTDKNNCMVTDSITVNNTNGPTVTLTKTETACNDSIGSVNASVSGGTEPYKYLWSSGDSTATINNLAAGIYKLTVTDLNNCQITDSIQLYTDSLAVTFTVTNSTCTNNKGKIISTVSGGTTPYNYSWSNNKNTGTITNLSAGVYKVTATDKKNCSVTDSVIVQFISGLADSMISDTVINTTCGNSNGSINVVVLSGTSPFTFSWNNGKTTSSISNLNAGTYKLTITDNNNCTFQKNYNITNKTGPTLTFTTKKDTCGKSNGSLKGNASGGTAPYTYLWNTGDDTSFIGGLKSGYYVLQVTDNNNCKVTDTAFVDMLMPRVTFVKPEATCDKSNGSATATASQGTAPYSYLWNTGENTSKLSNVAGGTYTLTVTDSKGCIIVGNAIINNTGNPVLRTWSRDASCGKNDGAAFVAVSGGKMPFTYTWNNGRTKDSIMNVTAGNYVINVTDYNKCKATGLAVVNNFNSPYVSFSNTNASCGSNNGSASAIVTGGAPPYSYSWSSGPNVSSISGLAPGSYYITVIDNNGCVATQTAIYFSSFLPEDNIVCDTLMTGCGSSLAVFQGNCETKGDLLCDTPAGEDLTGMVGYYPGCQYTYTGTGTGSDSSCMEYKPDAHNWMDYVFDPSNFSNYKCLGHFTKGQINRMYTCLLAHPTVNISRSYLWLDNPVPEKPDAVDPPVLIYPSDTALLATSSPLTFRWNKSAKAEGYIIKIYEGSSEKLKRYSNDTAIQIKFNFFTNKKWSYSVRPIHSNYFCNTIYSDKKEFYVKEIADGVDESIFTPELGIYPNPVENGEKITISLFMLSTLKTDLTVYDICGKKIENINIPPTNYSYKVVEIDKNHFSRGVYMLKFTNGKKVINHKLVVY